MVWKQESCGAIKGKIPVYRHIRYGTEKEIFISDFPLAYTIGIISLELVGGSREKKKN